MFDCVAYAKRAGHWKVHSSVVELLLKRCSDKTLKNLSISERKCTCVKWIEGERGRWKNKTFLRRKETRRFFLCAIKIKVGKVVPQNLLLFALFKKKKNISWRFMLLFLPSFFAPSPPSFDLGRRLPSLGWPVCFFCGKTVDLSVRISLFDVMDCHQLSWHLGQPLCINWRQARRYWNCCVDH